MTVIIGGCGMQKKYEIIENKCGTCHPASYVYNKKRPKNEWDRLVHGMKVRGLEITPEEEARVKEILYTEFSP